ncbi:HIT family protein [Nitrosophilus alvini]|uniref:HIT family protein n=1 Tax=Nitrosophilus alvini TaxID=2714855 RepID=UPI001F316585|nr:HIT family protein [Nitrosophilus alvini]
MKIFENELVYIQKEESEIPWLKIFTKKVCKEFSDCEKETREEIFRLLYLIEKEMIEYYRPEKINIASFGNYLPQVHFHIMARFKNDSFFPEPVWGKRQREAKLELPSFEGFVKRLNAVL